MRSESAVIQMNGAFQIEVLYGPQLSYFSLKNILAELGFEPASPSWETVAYSVLHKLEVSGTRLHGQLIGIYLQ